MPVNKRIDRSSGGLPIYRQLSKIIEAEIRDSHRSGDLLPSEQVLADRFGVNRHTVRRAIDELVAAGFVERMHGKGTYVLQTPINYAIHGATRFTETLASQGHRTASRILDAGQIEAEGGAARQLRLSDGRRVNFIETLREVDELPFCVSTHYLPSPDFDAVVGEYREGSLHDFISRRYGIRLRRILSLINAALPTRRDARHLKMPHNAPLLVVKSVNVAVRDGWPVEYVVTRFRGEAVQLSIKPEQEAQ